MYHSRNVTKWLYCKTVMADNKAKKGLCPHLCLSFPLSNMSIAKLIAVSGMPYIYTWCGSGDEHCMIMYASHN